MTVSLPWGSEPRLGGTLRAKTALEPIVVFHQIEKRLTDRRKFRIFGSYCAQLGGGGGDASELAEMDELIRLPQVVQFSPYYVVEKGSRHLAPFRDRS